LQCSYRDGIKFPESGAPRQVIRGSATHALTGLLASGKRLYDLLKRAPDFPLLREHRILRSRL